MEVSVTIDSAVADQLQTTLNAGSRSFLSGIILGLAQPPDPSLTDADQRSHFKVIATIPCPEEDADQPQANAKDPTRDLDDEWYAHHAQQVSRMIPGGLRVIGIYTSHANAPLPNPVYGAIHSLHLSASSHFLLLHTSKSGKLNAKALPVDQKRRCLESRSEPFVTIREADLLSTLSSISATVPFTTGVRTVIASAKAAKRCFQARTESTQRIRDGLLRSLQAFDHSQMDMILINPTSATPLPLGATLLPGSQVSVRLSLKARRFVAQIDASSDDGNESAEIFGSIHLRAYVSGDASLAQVKSALLEDLFRSVYSRLDILLDEVVDAPEEFERDEWQDLGDEMLQAFAKGVGSDTLGCLMLVLEVLLIILCIGNGRLASPIGVAIDGGRARAGAAI